MRGVVAARCEAGERVEQELFAVTRPNVWLLVFVSPLLAALQRRWFLVLTDRRVLALRVKRWSNQLDEVVWDEPRAAVRVVNHRPGLVRGELRLRRLRDGAELKLEFPSRGKDKAAAQAIANQLAGNVDTFLDDVPRRRRRLLPSAAAVAAGVAILTAGVVALSSSSSQHLSKPALDEFGASVKGYVTFLTNVTRCLDMKRAAEQGACLSERRAEGDEASVLLVAATAKLRAEARGDCRSDLTTLYDAFRRLHHDVGVVASGSDPKLLATDFAPVVSTSNHFGKDCKTRVTLF
jgi:hypothetical protein